MSEQNVLKTTLSKEYLKEEKDDPRNRGGFGITHQDL